jgi:hypothetical protein
MAKSPGFWFFTGDWMKDPELRFCSLFARGLLVDLLCILFEASEQGYASNPDGTPRTDEQIADAVSGGSREEKLAALSELEKSGVLSRDSRGVLFSRRIARLAELSESRKQSGSKGGSKPKAKPKQNDKQNRGVSVSVSDSDSFLNTHTHRDGSEFLKPGWAGDEWNRFVAVWNVTERAARWTPLVAPDGWVDLAASPGWLDRALQAVDKLPSCKFFEHPLAVTKFFEFVDRILAGEFDNAKQKRGQPPERPPPVDQAKRRYFRSDANRSMTDAEYQAWRRDQGQGGAASALATALKLKDEDT